LRGDLIGGGRTCCWRIRARVGCVVTAVVAGLASRTGTMAARRSVEPTRPSDFD